MTDSSAQVAGQQPESVLRRVSRSPATGFAPWVIFWVIGGPHTWETASIAALIAAVLVLLIDMDADELVIEPPSGQAKVRAPKLLDIATVIFFLGYVIAAVVTTRQNVADLDKYSQAISSGALGLIALGSVAFGHPFTIDYAKESVPEEYWHTPTFRRVNLVLSAMWAVVFIICAVLGYIAVHVTKKGAQDWLEWYLPIILIIIGFRFNAKYPDRVQQRLSGQGAGDS